MTLNSYYVVGTLDKDRICRVRLFGIDARERGLPYSKTATVALRGMLSETDMLIEIDAVFNHAGEPEIDRDRLVALIYPYDASYRSRHGHSLLPPPSRGRESLNLRMIKMGLATAYQRFLHLRPDLADDFRAAERIARQRGCGMHR